MIRKERALESEEKMKSELNDTAIESLNLTPSENGINTLGAKEKRNLHITDFFSEQQNIEMKQEEKSSEINEKQRQCKRKFQEETATQLEKKVEKKKRILCEEPKKKSNIHQNNESVSKVNSSIISKNTSNLLNYFSKATPEQLERERLKETTITIKAEIHNLQGLQPPDLLDNHQQQNFKPKDASSKKIIEEYDKILLVQSETIILSPNSSNEQKPDSSVPQSKPKWSLKIQLQSNGVQKPDMDDEIYMPTALSAQLKENVKNYRDIPKILLPIKNKKTGWNKTSSLINENKEKSRKNLITDIKTVKTQIEKNKAVQNTKSRTNLNCEIKKKNDFSTETKVKGNSCIILDKQGILNKTSAGRLAPLFLKNMKPNAETITAKHLFLQSESNKYTNNTEKKNIELMVQQFLPFPKISHINQVIFDRVGTLNILCKTKKYSEKNLFQPSINYSTIKTTSKFKIYNWISDEIYEPIKIDIDVALAQLKSYYSDIENLWDTVSKLSKSKNFKAEEVNMKKKKMSAHLTNDLQNSFLWTDKYKPNKSYEVVGNETAVSKLKTWLQNWQSLKIDENYSSSEEFYISDSSSSSDINNNKVAVLIGPYGSGKTASVYAVAQELGYMVLEVNASSRRPGKKILKEFEEATKSHRVKHFDLENFFSNSSCKIEEADQISKNSLIFMEDIDLIFEEDDGFISATFQLASNTKRPIVMTLRNACLHLAKMAPQQLRIDFKSIDGRKVIVLLQLIALAETGYQLNQNCLDALCHNGDLRKSLLQLQYLLISGRERILHTSLAVNDLSWSSMKTYIYKPAMKADKIRRKPQFQKHEIINNLVENLDNFSLVSNLMNIKDPTSIPINVKYAQSTSFIQNALPYCSLDDTSLEIGNWINNSVKIAFSSTCKEKTIDPNYTNEIFETPSKEQHINHINSVLSKIPSSSLDHQSVTVDYLPSIRNICRAEKVRSESNSKRGNRFFHYLHNSRLLTGSTKTSNIFSATCKMLQ